MLFVAAAFGAGIALRWGGSTAAWVALVLLIAASAGLGFRFGPSWANACLLLLLAGAGALRAEVDGRAVGPALPGGVAVVEGTVVSDPALSRDGRMVTAWFRMESSRGLMQARLPAGAGGFEYGESLRLSGMLREGRKNLTAPGTRVPGTQFGRRFDERRWLWIHRAAGVLTVPDAEGVTRLNHKEAGPWVRYRRWVARLRRALANQGRALLQAEEAGMLEALLLGEARGIRPETWEAFRKTGTVHVLVVSGSHVGLIGLIGLTLLAVFRTPLAARYLLLAGMLVTYCLLAGINPPIVRATLTGLLLCWGKGRGIEVSPLNLLGAAAAAILIAQPRALADPSFQLSFAAVAGVLLVNGWKTKNRFLKAAAVSCGAWLATAPLIAWHFHTFSPMTPLANLVVVPWASLLIADGFLACGAGLLAPAAAPSFAAAFAWLSRGLLFCVGRAAGLPGVCWDLKI